MFKAFYTVVMRDLLLAMRNRSDILTTLFFFVIAISLFPLGIGPELNTLREIAPGVFWVAALLASMLALERLFAIDFADGTLEQLLLTPQPTTLLVLAKVLAHWLITGVPLVLLSPLLGLQYDLSSEAIQALMLTLLLGTPSLSLI
ncbi:MAG TPA: heme exporter protein CcmB, partial [Gammaproteobacteria bacterium]|nr:heme exporter protein CcmB [Gammaproteobacteria bacterium]